MSNWKALEAEHYERMQDEINEKISKLQEAQDAIAEAIGNIEEVLKDHDFDFGNITNDLDQLHQDLEDAKDNLS